MFRKNEVHKQQRMFTIVDQLPESVREKLKNYWVRVFYNEFFCRLDETVFSSLSLHYCYRIERSSIRVYKKVRSECRVKATH